MEFQQKIIEIKEKIEQKSGTKIGDKFKIKKGKTINIVEVIDYHFTFNSNCEIIDFCVIVKQEKKGLINEMIYELCCSTFKLLGVEKIN